MTSAEGYTCTCCGEAQTDVPFAFHIAAPDMWRRRYTFRRDSELASDACIVKGRHLFLRGLVEIPVHGVETSFQWGVWASLSEEAFTRTADLWEQPGRETEPPVPGTLATTLPLYEQPTLGLEVLVHTRPVGERPAFVLAPSDHPLAVEQREGITLARVHEIAQRLTGPA